MHLGTSRLIAVLAALWGVGCTSAGNCTVTDNTDGTATISCPDGTSTIVRNGADGRGRLVRVDAEPVGEQCAAGGFAIHVGEDANGNGTLENDEIDSTQYACNGADGTGTLVRLVPEPAGENCTAGGYAILAGRDTDGSGALEDDEVTTSYVCHGAAGRDAVATLVRVRDEAPGPSCEHGGKAILVGADTDGSGTLEDAEVTSTSYVCNGAPGADGADGTNGLNALVSVTPEPRGLNCANGGQKIRAGIDANGNGTLEEDEVTSTSYVCDGAAPTLVPGSTSSVMRDGWSVRCLVWSGRICTRPQVMMSCDVCSSYPLCGVWHDLTDVNDFGEGWQAKNFCAIATGNAAATWSSGPDGSAVAPRACNWLSSLHPLCGPTRATYVPVDVPGTHEEHALSLEDGYCSLLMSRALHVDCAAW